ncbi:hypothetical protein [uncultured Roseobacter sp.]|uniref:hypothetical protein n=1 Tax=uncultured Roseobacter sp. TaxID=114847 RepID=UPI00261A41D0|nr:hypothetical protein [uncultured Roseobacter sp.]
MGLKPLVLFRRFFEEIEQEIESRDDEIEYKNTVKTVTDPFKLEKFGKWTRGGQDAKWQEWLSDAKEGFDNDAWKIVACLTGDNRKELAYGGGTGLIHAVAMHYRLHGYDDQEDLKYADEIDVAVFGCSATDRLGKIFGIEGESQPEYILPRSSRLSALYETLPNKTLHGVSAQDFANLIRLPPDYQIGLIKDHLPTESSPYTWSDHLSNRFDPTASLCGNLISVLATEAAYPGFVTPQDRLNYSLMLSEFSYLFPAKQKEIIRRFAKNSFSLARDGIFGAVNPMIWHCFEHNFGNKADDYAIGVVKDNPVALKYLPQVEEKIATSESALAWAESVTELLPLWKETRQEMIAYEKVQLFMAELSRPLFQNKARLHWLSGWFEELEPRTLSERRSKLIGETTAHFHGLLDKDILTFLSEECTALLTDRLDADNTLFEACMLNFKAQSHAADASEYLTLFLDDQPNEKLGQLIAYRAMLLPKLRKLIIESGARLGVRSSLLGHLTEDCAFDNWD